jgi:hypothetical protein
MPKIKRGIEAITKELVSEYRKRFDELTSRVFSQSGIIIKREYSPKYLHSYPRELIFSGWNLYKRQFVIRKKHIARIKANTYRKPTSLFIDIYDPLMFDVVKRFAEEYESIFERDVSLIQQY